MRRTIPVVVSACLIAGYGVAAAKPPVPKPTLSKPTISKPPAKPTKTEAVKPPAAKPSAPKAKGDQPKPKGDQPKPETKPLKPAPFVKHIENNPALASRLLALLPSGTSLESAAAGFKNQGQFIAALHVSRNLNIPFADLKAAMTGKPHESLGRAIQELRPGVDAKQAARLGEFEGKVDLEEAKENSADNHGNAVLRNGPFIRRLQSNPTLVALLTPLVPAGMTLASAAQGFKSEEQFVAALHASHNLNIPFAQLKAEMTGRDHDQLAVAIFEQKPDIDALAEARKAIGQARSDLQTTDTKH
jgi:hypothetical protein